MEPDRLMYGPYVPPKVKRGAELQCEINGMCIVAGYHDADIPWPLRKIKGRPSLIVCGALLSARARETNVAVASHWGVSVSTVCRWRMALGIAGELNEATRIRYSEIMTQKRSDQPAIFVDPGAAMVASFTQIERRLNGTRSAAWLWSPEQDILLGSLPDEVIAAKLGRSVQAVRCRKMKLKITTAALRGIPCRCRVCGYEWLAVGKLPKKCANPNRRHRNWR